MTVDRHDIPNDTDPERMAALIALEEKARRLGHTIGDGLPQGVGFVVWLFEFGNDGWATYISNAQRETMIEALEELLVKLKTKPKLKPRSKA